MAGIWRMAEIGATLLGRVVRGPLPELAATTSQTLSATPSETRSPGRYAVANAALYFGADAARSSSVTSSTLEAPPVSDAAAARRSAAAPDRAAPASP